MTGVQNDKTGLERKIRLEDLKTIMIDDGRVGGVAHESLRGERRHSQTLVSRRVCGHDHHLFFLKCLIYHSKFSRNFLYRCLK